MKKENRWKWDMDNKWGISVDVVGGGCLHRARGDGLKPSCGDIARASNIANSRDNTIVTVFEANNAPDTKNNGPLVLIDGKWRKRRV